MKRKIKLSLIVVVCLFLLIQVAGFCYFFFEFNIPSFKLTDVNIKLDKKNNKATLFIDSTMLYSLVKIKAGKFYKGSEMSIDTLKSLFGEQTEFLDGESPITAEKIEKSFWLGESEITNQFFDLFIRSTDYKTLAERQGFGWLWKNNQFEKTENVSWKNFSNNKNSPVVMIAWQDAKAFTKWLSSALHKKVRLPIAAEWEYACKAGTNTIYCFGNNTKKLDKFAWYEENTLSLNSSQSVMQKSPNEWGLYDMHGNVWEWCEDSQKWWDLRHKSIRGGSWLNKGASLRSSFNAFEHTDIVEPHIGFRILIEE